MSNQNYILGIDPGTHRLGWGIISGNRQKPILIDCGCLELPPHTEPVVYLVETRKFLLNLISKYQISHVGIEKLFAQHNQKTVISVAESRGVILLTFAEASIPISEFSPNTIKSTVAGTGASTKSEVERMVRLLLGMPNQKLLDDTTDALAVALTAQILNI